MADWRSFKSLMAWGMKLSLTLVVRTQMLQSVGQMAEGRTVYGWGDRSL